MVDVSHSNLPSNKPDISNTTAESSNKLEHESPSPLETWNIFKTTLWLL
jgi:hypothetical protein